MSRRPLFYRILYSPGTAALMILAAGAFLAVANGRAVYDFFQGVHPEWGSVFLTVNAAGTELGIVAVGLVFAATGKRWLLIGETVLVAASSWISYLVAAGPGGPWSWEAAQVGIPAASIPLLYLIIVLAGHHLMESMPEDSQEPATRPERHLSRPQPVLAHTAPPSLLSPASGVPAARATGMPTGNAEGGRRQPAPPPEMPEGVPEVTTTQRRNAERYARLAAEVGESTKAIAERLGVSPRTVRNYRDVARKLGLVAA